MVSLLYRKCSHNSHLLRQDLNITKEDYNAKCYATEMRNLLIQSASISESIGAAGLLHNQPRQVSFEESDDFNFSPKEDSLNGGGGGGDKGG